MGEFESVAALRAEQILAESEAHLRAIFEHAGVGATQVNLVTGRFMWANARYCDFLGYAWEELRQLSVSDVTVPDDRVLFVDAWTEMRRGASNTYEFDKRYRRKDGAICWARVSGRAIRGPTGELIGALAVVIDITQQKHAEEAMSESEVRFRTLANVVPSIVWMAAPDGAITFVSDRWFEYTGLTPEDNAHWLQRVVHPDDRRRCIEAWARALREGFDYEIELRNRRHDGAYRWFLTRAVPLRDARSDITGWFGTTTDIHDQKQAEQALRLADRRKDEFLAMLGHELRNPLAPIRNAVEILKRTAPDADRLAWARDVIGRQVGQLTRMVDDLLDVSRITQGKIALAFAPTSLDDVVERAVEISMPLIEQRQQQLTVSLPEETRHIDCDLARLSQVLANLLNNAAKYTRVGGAIHVKAETEQEQVVFRVRDTGQGIAPEVLPAVFELFTQADHSLERSQGGLGIGLTVARHLVEMHDGTLTAASDGIGKGSEFTVRIPLRPAAERPETRDDNPAYTSAPRRILIVDDNAESATSLALLLQLAGHKVRTANDGRAALDLAANLAPDAVLLDIGLPQMDGYDVARHLRAQLREPRPLVIAITGYGQEECRVRAREAGFDHYLVKPIERHALGKIARGDEVVTGHGICVRCSLTERATVK